MWKVVRHRAILLHGPAAAVLQIAHPRVGLGVMEHSRFADAPLDRLHRTLDAVYTIAFGSAEEARAAAAKVARRHASMRGDAAVHGVAGPPTYDAGEIELLMWVTATLVWSAVGGYERTVGPLSDDEKDRFYRDMRVLGTFFGLPTEYGPQSYRDYLDYFGRVVGDPLIGAHAVSRRVAWAVARPRTPWWFRLAGLPITFIFSEILPPAVRDRLGYRRTIFSRCAIVATTKALRLFARFAPRRLRLVPQYRSALRAIECPPCFSPPSTFRARSPGPS
jgi:uncharacterized protein (DUF2236 family)